MIQDKNIEVNENGYPLLPDGSVDWLLVSHWKQEN